jgi:hypothetical protein
MTICSQPDVPSRLRLGRPGEPAPRPGEPRPDVQLTHPARVVQRALKRLGVEIEAGEGFHTLRRSAARAFFDSMAAAGHDEALRMTSAFLHHSSTQVTEVYLGLRHERVTENPKGSQSSNNQDRANQPERGQGILEKKPTPSRRPRIKLVLQPSRPRQASQTDLSPFETAPADPTSSTHQSEPSKPTHQSEPSKPGRRRTVHGSCGLNGKSVSRAQSTHWIDHCFRSA